MRSILCIPEIAILYANRAIMLTVLFLYWLIWEQFQPQDRDYFGNTLHNDDPPMFV